MVYSKAEGVESGGYVLCIIVDGEALKENADGTVEVPYGAEYQIRLRNKTNRRACATIYLDDEKMQDRLVLSANNDFVDLDCDPNTKRRFKFVTLDSSEAVDAGKNRPKDKAMGVVRVEFVPEKTYTQTQPTWWHGGLVVGHQQGSWNPTNITSRSAETTTNQLMKQLDIKAEMAEPTSGGLGATVEGSISSQGFTRTTFNQDYSVAPVQLKLVLRGYHRPQASRQGSYCGDCGAKKSRATARFCEMCGHALV